MVALAGSAEGQVQRIPDFKAPAVFIDGVGDYPFGIDAADAIGNTDTTPDGYPDVVFAIGQMQLDLFTYNQNSHGFLAVYRNTQDWATPSNGLSQFQNIDLGAETVPGEVKWAEMTGDTRLDIVVAVGTPEADPDYTCQTCSPGIMVYRFDSGTHNYRFRWYLPTQYPVRGLTVGDFDNDGDTDVAASVDYWEQPDPDKDLIYVALNDGTGVLSLSPESPYELDAAGGDPSSSGPGDVVAGNFDLIPGVLQWPDLFSSGADSYGHSSVVCGSNAGGAVFSFADVAQCPPYLTDIEAGVFTAGHLYDDAVGVTAAGEVCLFHGDGNGGFTFNCGDEPNDIYVIEGGILTSFYPLGVDVGNFNAGTKLDVVVADTHGSEVVCLLGKGDGTLQHSLYDSRYYHDVGADRPIRVVVADMDQDGFDDIVTSNHGDVNDFASISVLINKFTISSE